MKKVLRCLIVLVAAFPCATNAAFAEPNKYAVLIGVSPYTLQQVLTQDHILYGPKNDALLMWKTLTGEGLKASDIILLANLKEGPQPDPNLSPELAPLLPAIQNLARWPSRQNILAALDEIATRAHSGDQVLIFFSGHGSALPEKPDADGHYHELDKTVNLILPIDIGTWDPATKAVTNQIADYELDSKIEAIQSKGASVWLIEDSCYSGSIDRALAFNKVGYQTKEILPVQLKVPKNTAIAVPASAGNVMSGHDVGESGTFVGFYAATGTTEAVQTPMPRGANGERPNDSEPFGLLTYYLVQAIRQHRATDFKDLALAVQGMFGDYQHWNGESSVTPFFSGKLRAAVPFVGGGKGGTPSYAVVGSSIDNLYLEAGLFDNIGDKTRFALWRSDDVSGAPFGYAQVDSPGPRSSHLTIIAYNGQNAIDSATFQV